MKIKKDKMKFIEPPNFTELVEEIEMLKLENENLKNSCDESLRLENERLIKWQKRAMKTVQDVFKNLNKTKRSIVLADSKRETPKGKILSRESCMDIMSLELSVRVLQDDLESGLKLKGGHKKWEIIQELQKKKI